MEKRIFIRFFGRVQGVGFRWNFLRIAKGTPFTGRLDNMEDGTVLLVIEGEESAILPFIEECSQLLRRPINCTHYHIEKSILKSERTPFLYTDLGVGYPE